MKLRDYQEKALLLARDSIRRGLKRPIIAAPTGVELAAPIPDKIEGIL